MNAHDPQLRKMLHELGVTEEAYEDFSPEWQSGNELSKLSIDAMVRKQQGTERATKSEGFLRITGDGVTGHEADLDAVGLLMTVFQRLVTATGAIIEGHGLTRGRVPSNIANETQLSLVAQPTAGSIVLTIVPKIDELRTAFPKGATLWGYEMPNKVLADDSISKLIALLSSIDLRDINPFIALVKDGGPRQAGILKTFLKMLAVNAFDIEVKWSTPGKSIEVVTLSNETSNFAYRSIEMYRADTYEEDIEGEIRTISTTRMLEIVPDSPPDDEAGAINIKRGELSTLELSSLSVTERVCVHVRTTPEITPGSIEPKLVREALSIRKL